MIQRAIYLTILIVSAALTSFVSAQPREVRYASGVQCQFYDNGDRNGWVYEMDNFGNYLQFCCEEAIQPSISTRVDCESYCNGNGWSWLYGSFRDGSYTSCMCLTPCAQRAYQTLFVAIFPYSDGWKPIPPAVQSLATSTSFTLDLYIQDGQYTPISISPQQTARLRTTETWENGNSATIHAIPSIQTVTGTVGFTLRSALDHRASFYDLQLQNNSLAVQSNAFYYEAPLQTKRQTPYYWTYYLQNTGSDVLVVLGAGPEIVASWHYSPIAFDTDSSITSKLGSFVFDIDVHFDAILLNRCEDRVLGSGKEIFCTDGFILHYCADQIAMRKFCHLGCDWFSGGPLRDCLPCNSTLCQGTCVPTATSERCECSGTRVGAGCELDLATTSSHLALFERLPDGGSSFYADIENCELGKNCATFTHGQPPSENGETYQPGSCCAATFNLTSLERNLDSTVLRFERVSEWSCFLAPTLEVNMAILYDSYELRPPQLTRDLPYWQYRDTQPRVNSERYFVCDSSVNSTEPREPKITASFATVRDPVSAVFVGTSGAAVAVGFIVGFIVKPERMALKSKKAKGCLPKGEQSFARSILAIIILDVALVTVFGIVGLNFPITMLVFASGIMLIISAKLVRTIGSRFHTTMLVRRLLIVQHVFGCFAGAFLIVIGLGLFLFELSASISELAIITQFTTTIVPWLILGTYCFWAFVIVHFATAIQSCVSFYFSLVKRKNSRKSSSVKKSEKGEHVEMTKQASSNSSDSEQNYQQHVIVPITQQPYQQQFIVPSAQAMNEPESSSSERSAQKSEIESADRSASESPSQSASSLHKSMSSSSESNSLPSHSQSARETGSSRGNNEQERSASDGENSGFLETSI